MSAATTAIDGGVSTVKLKLYRHGRATQVTVENVAAIERHPYDPPLENKTASLKLDDGRVVHYRNASFLDGDRIEL